MLVASNFTLYTSHSAAGRLCETKPIRGEFQVWSVKFEARWTCETNAIFGRSAMIHHRGRIEKAVLREPDRLQ